MDPADFQGEADSGEDDSPLEVTKVFTSTSGSKPLDAQLVGQDKYWGLEFYRLTESNLPAAPLGDANSLERGEKLIVLNRNTASNLPIFFSGLFQELDQDLCLSQADELASSGPACLSERHQEALLISSLAGEQGLGGPLVDFNGSVMGLTVSSLGRDSSVASPSEEGQLVVISVNRIKDSMARITQEEAVEAGFLGVRYQPITEELAMVNQLPANQGARIVGFYSSSIDQAGEPGRISRVASISPALRAGLQAGDIITQVDDQKATLENPLSEIINQKEAGQEVLVKFFRGEKELEINVTLD
jgi:serine protease Do